MDQLVKAKVQQIEVIESALSIKQSLAHADQNKGRFHNEVIHIPIS
jgi:hypothetical protein